MEYDGAFSNMNSNRNLREFLEQSGRPDRVLPLTHTTDVSRCVEIFDTATLKANPTGDGENIAYLSYGKATFIPNEDLVLDVTERDSPVIFIFRPTGNYQVRRVIPFDSSVYIRGDHKEFLKRNLNREKLELGESVDAAARFVNLFYGGNTGYLDDAADFRNEPTKNGSFPPPEARELANLLKTRVAKGADRRYFTVELQIENDVDIYQSVLEHVILPKFFRDPAYFHYVEIIRVKWGIEPTYYDGRCYNPIRQQTRAEAESDRYIESAYVNA